MAGTTISVVIPCYNAEQWLRQSIESVLGQGQPGVDVIVIDDGSTDGSVAVLRSFGADIRWEAQPNRGAGAARNRGLALSNADYVMFLDADDYLEGPYLRDLAASIGDDIDVVLGCHIRLDAAGARTETQRYLDVRDNDALLATYLDRPLQTGGILWRRGFVAGIGGWDPELSIFQDAEIAIRGFLANPRFAVADVPDSRAVWRTHHGGDRITNSFPIGKAESTLRGLEKHFDALAARGDPGIARGLQERYYTLSRIAFLCGHRAVGRRALARARQLGLDGHLGTFAHRLVSRAVGLEAKMRLTGLLYRHLSSVQKQERPYPYNLI